MAESPRWERYPDPARTVEVAFRGKQFVEFVYHAIQQMKRRGMTEREVLKTLESPSSEREDRETKGRTVAFRDFGMHTAKVVYVASSDRFRVISVMWIKKRLSGR